MFEVPSRIASTPQHICIANTPELTPGGPWPTLNVEVPTLA